MNHLLIYEGYKNLDFIRKPKVGDIIKLNWQESYGYTFIVEVVQQLPPDSIGQIYTKVKFLLFKEGDIQSFRDASKYRKFGKMGRQVELDDGTTEIRNLRIRQANVLTRAEKKLVREYKISHDADKFGI